MRTSHVIASAALVLAGAAACKSNDSSAAADSAAGSVPAVPSMPSDSNAAPGTAAAAAGNTAPGDTTAAGTPATDDQILGKALVGDSTEVAAAKFVQGATKNAAVKRYAAELERDHGKGVSDVEKLAAQLKLTPQVPANDTTAQAVSHVIDRMKSLSGNDLDTAFVNHEVEDHQEDIADAKKMEASAKSPQVKAMLKKELPELERHLADAKKLQSQLGGTKKK